MRKYVVAGIFTVAFILSGFLIAPTHAQLGGYRSIEVDDATAVAAANFAVSKEEETTEGIELAEILKAERQSVAGANYRLCLRVKLGEDTQEVQAIVNLNLQGVYSLTSWTPKDCDGS
ncbi:MAG: cystatin domain-containing protein [Pyrinomonadaceae bacterium]